MLASVVAHRAEARAAVVGYIEGFYNRMRPHSTIGYQTPAGKMEALMEQCDAAFAEPAAGSDGIPLAA